MGSNRSGLANPAASPFPPPESPSGSRPAFRPSPKAFALEAAPAMFLTADETAALLRTTRKAVYAMAERGRLPGVVRIGRRLLVRRDVLLQSLCERRAASPGGNRR